MPQLVRGRGGRVFFDAVFMHEIVHSSFHYFWMEMAGDGNMLAVAQKLVDELLYSIKTELMTIFPNVTSPICHHQKTQLFVF